MQGIFQTLFPAPQKSETTERAASPASGDSANMDLDGQPTLKETLAELIPKQQARLTSLKNNYGDRKLADVTLLQVLQGGRGVPAMIWDGSLLDAKEGIRFRGMSIPEVQSKLPGAVEDGQPLPEALLWLLLTDQVPTKAQVDVLAADIRSRAELSPRVTKVIDSMAGAHPMSQLSAAVLAMQPDSKFAKAYESGVRKAALWEPAFEDALDLIAKLPVAAARIYKGAPKMPLFNAAAPKPADGADWAQGLVEMMGHPGVDAAEMMRLYMVLHADHEGGNVSAHAVHLVHSTLSDPFLAFSAGINGLAGPLHGLANQEVLRFLHDVTKQLGENPTDEALEGYIWGMLKAGQVVPGFGHAVLTSTDPRYTCQAKFAEQTMPGDPLYELVKQLYRVAPKVLMATGKVRNPWPNVDAHSGVLLSHYGITRDDFYTVLFAVARSLGCMSQVVWARALGYPLERPKSLTFDALEKRFATEDAKAAQEA